MESKTGIESSMEEDDIKDYMNEVIEELRTSKSRSSTSTDRHETS